MAKKKQAGQPKVVRIKKTFVVSKTTIMTILDERERGPEALNQSQVLDCMAEAWMDLPATERDKRLEAHVLGHKWTSRRR